MTLAVRSRQGRRSYRALGLTWPAGLLIITLGAVATAGRQRIELYNSIDEADRNRRLALFTGDALCLYADYGRLGRFEADSFDALILSLMDKHVT